MADDPPSPVNRHRPSKMATENGSLDGPTATTSSPSSPASSSSTSRATAAASSLPQQRNAPHLPTPAEAAVLALYPALLIFGSVFSLVSPQVRAATYDAASQSLLHSQAPSYFARKDNLFNVLFVKQGWAWISVAFAAFVLTHPHHTAAAAATSEGGGGGAAAGRHIIASRRARAALRWALVTGWWFLVTQWFFGPPLIDRGFRFTGGKCEEVEAQVFGSGRAQGVANSSPAEVFSAAACRAAGGRWRGGHDISGHVFLLVLGSFFLLQEVGWIAARAWTATGPRDPRAVVMHDGAVKSADVEGDRMEKERERRQQEGGVDAALGFGGKIVAGVVALSVWMLLMTAIYFHTWFEKLTGLLVALVGLYAVYILPRFLPALRRVVGLPGI